MGKFINYLTIGILSVFLFSCSDTEKTDGKENSVEKEIEVVQEIQTPANAGSSIPNLHVSTTGTTYLTWTETQENGVAVLYYSILKGDKWQQPVKISEANNWVVNWADFPSLIQFGENLVVNVLVETNKETYAYDVQLIISNDNGNTWNKPFSPHTDGTQTEHGFVSMTPYEDKTFMAVWLDGRKYDAGEDEMTLRAAIINKEGKIQQEFILDERVCDCCATDAVVTKDGIAVVYRNRDDNETRDMSIVYFKDGKWSEPKIIAKDNWVIAGCPVNGPAIDAVDNSMVIAWFTSANDNAKVNVIFSEDSGNSFSKPLEVNTKQSEGRVDICYLNKDKIAVSWMEDEYIKVRAVNTNSSNKMSKPIIVSATEGSRASGFPKMVKFKDELIFTWTETGDKKMIKTAKMNIAGFEKMKFD